VSRHLGKQLDKPLESDRYADDLAEWGLKASRDWPQGLVQLIYRVLCMMKIPVLEYQSVRSYNREVFFIEHADLVKAFVATDNNFNTLIRLPATMRDGNGSSHVALIPFVFLLQRQAQSAFEALTAFQSYQAWVLLRPGIEAALIIGKWVDDPKNAEIWKNRENDPKPYQKSYTGKALRSKSLPNSEPIQGVLRKINDDFVHANPEYYKRHLTVAPGHPEYVKMLLQYFDDDSLLLVNVFAFLHTLLIVQQALLSLFNKLFSCNESLPSPLELFIRTYEEKIDKRAGSAEEHRRILKELGMWKVIAT